KPTDTHVNVENPFGGLLKEAISKGIINFYNYDQFSDLTMIDQEESDPYGEHYTTVLQFADEGNLSDYL
ncbi:11352_t:CDS:2, partial [Gigaspora margarita]